MKRRTFATIFILAMTLLSSCGKKEIRSDIAEFIASFSVEAAVEAYKKTEFNKVQTVHLDGDVTVTYETINFDVTDTQDPQYHRHLETYVNDALTESIDQYIKHENDAFYVVINESEYEYDLEKCHDLIRQFFYKNTYLDGTYHADGYYYGDMVKGSIEDYQDYIIINQDIQKLVFSHCQNQTQNGRDVRRCSTFHVDALGMLTYNFAVTTAGEDEARTEITIAKK